MQGLTERIDVISLDAVSLVGRYLTVTAVVRQGRRRTCSDSGAMGEDFRAAAMERVHREMECSNFSGGRSEKRRRLMSR